MQKQKLQRSKSEQDTEVADFVLIRENDGKWREPLVEIEEEKDIKEND